MLEIGISFNLALILLALLGLIIDKIVEKAGWLKWLHNDSAPILSFVIGALIGELISFSGVVIGALVAGGICAMGSDGIMKIMQRSKSLAGSVLEKAGSKKK